MSVSDPGLSVPQLGNALFEALFESAAIGVAVVSLQGQILRANRACEKLFGYSEQEP